MANRLFTDDEAKQANEAFRDLKAAVLKAINPVMQPILNVLARLLRRF